MYERERGDCGLRRRSTSRRVSVASCGARVRSPLPSERLGIMASFLRSTKLVSKLTQGPTKCFSRNYADQMNFTFAAANQIFYANKNIKQVDVPSFSGSFGILPNHVPTLAVLRPGVVTVYEDEGTSKKIFVSSGTITVNEDSSVQVLAEEAHPIEDIDGSAARQVLQEAQSQLSTASGDVAKAEAAIAVEVAEALVLAAGN
ncbi:hypothetical protein ACI65C_012679 [Semiaphis heraclei]